jgi:hypothetical protein
VLVHEAVVGLGVVAREAHVFILCGWLVDAAWGDVLAFTYHVEGYDILERDLAGAVALHEDLVDYLGAAAGRKTQDEGIRFGGIESLDAAWVRLSVYASQQAN